MQMTARDKIIKARTGLLLDASFFGTLALRLKLVEDPKCQTGYTDGVILGYNPEFVNKLSLAQLKGFLAHEVMHPALGHTIRRNGRDPYDWNIAGDLAINAILENAGFELPPGRLIDYQHPDASADEHYARVHGRGKEDAQQPQQTPPGEGNEGEDGDGSGSGDGESGDQPGDAGDGDGQDGDAQGDGQGNGAPGQGSGSGSGKPSDPGGCGEVRDLKNPDGSALSEAQQTELEREWKTAVQQAAQQAKAMGDFPGDLASVVEEVLAPKVDWRDVLRRFIDSTAKNDYSWMRPNRRHIADGLYLPGLNSEKMKPLALTMDTSGSTYDPAILARFTSEINAILEEFQMDTIVIYCDTRVTSTEEISSEDLPIVLHPTGGGGTDFRPPFTYLEEHPEIDVACMIYLTDLECNRYPETEPDYPVLWAVIGERASYYGAPPFGEEIAID